MPDGSEYRKTVTQVSPYFFFLSENPHSVLLTGEHKGDTIAQVKKLLSDEKGIPYSNVSLSLAGNALMDPLSLNDIPAARGKTELTLQVQLKK